jgi:hypothetical protein
LGLRLGKQAVRYNFINTARLKQVGDGSLGRRVGRIIEKYLPVLITTNSSLFLVLRRALRCCSSFGWLPYCSLYGCLRWGIPRRPEWWKA